MVPAEKHAASRRPFRQGFVVLIALVLFIFGSIYITTVNTSQIQALKDQALTLAKTASVYLPVEWIETLSVNESDLQKDTYHILKSGLIRLKALNPNVTFTYLITQKDGQYYFMADSEQPEDAGYSPPGQHYYEAPEVYRLAYSKGEAMITDSVTDRWGKWYSVLVPIVDPSSGHTMAMLGMDYDAAVWASLIQKHAINTVAVIGLTFLLVALLYLMYRHSKERELLLHRLDDSEILFRTVFQQAPFGIAIVDDYTTVSSMNAMVETILKRPSKELMTIQWSDITDANDLAEEDVYYKQFTAGETDGYSIEKRVLCPDGTYTWVQLVIARLHLSHTGAVKHLCILHDIQDRKTAQEALKESERSKSVLLSHLPGMAYRCLNDKDWTMLFVSEGCQALTGYSPNSLLHNRDLSFNDLIDPAYRDFLRGEWDRLLKQRETFRCEYQITAAGGEKKWVLEMGQGIYDEYGQVEALEGIVIDVTDSKRQQSQIQHINDHDFLTGIYSRKYYEEAKRQLDHAANYPLSIIIADINGIRMLNNAFGYELGDMIIKQIAEILQNCCRQTDVIARTGGDEFGILLPCTDQAESYRIVQRMKDASEQADFGSLNQSICISISLGCGTKASGQQQMDAIEREAEENLHKNKLLEQKSFHNAMLTSIMATMNARSQETEEHALRLVSLSRMVGEHLALPQKSLDDLQLLAMLHDIGKVGIDDRILNKPGKLSEEEWAIMKKHPEIGYRIVSSLSELASIGEYILTHHERWDGKGYPKGLKGEEIPLPSRILSVVDAYDAMTEERVYRKKRSHEEAMEEILNNSGTQFDPAIVEIFAHCMR